MSVGIAQPGYGLDGSKDADPSVRAVYGVSATTRVLRLRVRISPGAWMFVLCVVNNDKKARSRTVKTKTQVRMKYRVQENTRKDKRREAGQSRQRHKYG
jgi:hypothetical protein